MIEKLGTRAAIGRALTTVLSPRRKRSRRHFPDLRMPALPSILVLVLVTDRAVDGDRRAWFQMFCD